MIFVLAKNEPTLMVMLTEADVQSMREGRTQFVDHRQIGKNMFNKVVLSVQKNKAEQLSILKQAGHYVDDNQFFSVLPESNETVCDDCKGRIANALMFEGKCNICWATMAKKKKDAIESIERSIVELLENCPETPGDAYFSNGWGAALDAIEMVVKRENPS